MEEISGQIVVKFWGYKKQDFVKCLKINNLQSLVVPRMGAKESGAIVSCQFLLIVLNDRRLGLCSVSCNNTRKW